MRYSEKVALKFSNFSIAFSMVRFLLPAKFAPEADEAPSNHPHTENGESWFLPPVEILY
jgi:hypothetical protein